MYNTCSTTVLSLFTSFLSFVVPLILRWTAALWKA